MKAQEIWNSTKNKADYTPGERKHWEDHWRDGMKPKTGSRTAQQDDDGNDVRDSNRK
jgi:hypothetical protein